VKNKFQTGVFHARFSAKTYCAKMEKMSVLKIAGPDKLCYNCYDMWLDDFYPCPMASATAQCDVQLKMQFFKRFGMFCLWFE
jgi:hypothetical protein